MKTLVIIMSTLFIAVGALGPIGIVVITGEPSIETSVFAGIFGLIHMCGGVALFKCADEL